MNIVADQGDHCHSVVALCLRVGMSRQNYYAARRLRQRREIDEGLLLELVRCPSKPSRGKNVSKVPFSGCHCHSRIGALCQWTDKLRELAGNATESNLTQRCRSLSVETTKKTG